MSSLKKLKQDKSSKVNVENYIKKNEIKTLIRFITCGSVDDGKSTLIGRLLFDTKSIYSDQLKSLEKDSFKHGTQGNNFDLALLVDGLAAEKEQGITIDVAYRFFSTNIRKFIIADTPGHEQYTRNMVTGASTADLAIILVDATKGILPQTKRHTYLVNLLGVKKIILAVNKMDLINYDKKIFDKLTKTFREFFSIISTNNFFSIPISALNGENIIKRSGKMKWFKEKTLLSYLETVSVGLEKNDKNDFSLPVQWVNRPNSNFRGFSGLIASGSVQKGDEIKILPSGKKSVVKDIFLYKKTFKKALAGQSVTLTMLDNLDCSKGDVITSSNSNVRISNHFQTTIFWMDETPMLPGRSYILKTTSKITSVSITKLKYEVNINTLEPTPSKQIEVNSIAVCNLSTNDQIIFDKFNNNRQMGNFILIDKTNYKTVGAGIINFSLQRANNLYWETPNITKEDHQRQKCQKGIIIFLTGISGSGKSTIANLIQKQLFKLNKHSFILDGDNIRHGLNKDLGFTDADRVENIRRVGEVGKLMVEAGLITVIAFISPFNSERKLVREMVEKDEFIEVFINTSLEVAEKRDVKGLYKKAREGKIINFTGIDSPYEFPINPEIIIDTNKISAERASKIIVDYILKPNNFVKSN